MEVPSITTTDSDITGDFPAGLRFLLLLLPSAPPSAQGKPLPTLPSFSRAFFPSIQPPSQNNLCPSLCIILGRRQSGFLREEEEERSWAAHGHRLLTVWWVWKAQRLCNTVLVFALWAAEPQLYPHDQQRLGENSRRKERKGEEAGGKEKEGKEKRRRWNQQQARDL